jgi:hypothetical protein
MSGLLILENTIICLRIKPSFYALNECNTRQIFIGDDRSLSVVGSRVGQLDGGHYVLCVPSLFCNLLLVYQITYSNEGKKIEFSPHQVVIKDLKYPTHVLTTRIVEIILLGCTDLTTLGHHLVHQFLLLIAMT